MLPCMIAITTSYFAFTSTMKQYSALHVVYEIRAPKRTIEYASEGITVTACIYTS